MKFLKFCLTTFLFSIVSSQIVNGCSCGIAPPPCYQYWESDAVFVGTIKRVYKEVEFPFDKVEVDIEENLRGMPFKTAFTNNIEHPVTINLKKTKNFFFMQVLTKKRLTNLVQAIARERPLIQKI